MANTDDSERQRKALLDRRGLGVLWQRAGRADWSSLASRPEGGFWNSGAHAPGRRLYRGRSYKGRGDVAGARRRETSTTPPFRASILRSCAI